MPDTATSETVNPVRPSTAAWQELGWKVLAALLILLVSALALPVASAVLGQLGNGLTAPLVLLAWTPCVLLLWGGAMVLVAERNLYAGPAALRSWWVTLALGAYAALAIPALFSNGSANSAAAFAPVAALTLVAHLARRDLPQALRDWATIMAIALFSALGVQAVWVLMIYYLMTPENLLVLALVVLCPPVILDALLIPLRSTGNLRDSLWAEPAAVFLSAAVPVAVFASLEMRPGFLSAPWLVFVLAIVVLVGGALMVSLLTKPLADVASGGASGGGGLGRALVQLSHGSLLIALALYLPLRLLTGGAG
jgi:hypothetical protein